MCMSILIPLQGRVEFENSVKIAFNIHDYYYLRVYNNKRPG